jgi:hypothetical protein
MSVLAGDIGDPRDHAGMGVGEIRDSVGSTSQIATSAPSRETVLQSRARCPRLRR